MRSQVATRRIRWGILCLPLAGLVYLQGLLVTGEYVFPSDDLRGYAEYVTSARFQSGLLIFHLQAALLLVGFFALYAYLTSSRAERWALAGIVLLCASAIGSGVRLGFDVPLIPAAQAYLEGQQGALNSVNFFAVFTDLPVLLVVWLLATGPLFDILVHLLFGVAIWRSGTLPQGVAILWIGSAVLALTFLIPYINLGAWIEALVTALDLGGSGWIAYSVWQQPADRLLGQPK